MPIPRIIHFTIPTTASSRQLEIIDIATWLHPEWKVMVWRDPVPPGKFRLSKYWRATNSGAQLADLVRIEVVLNYGGIYLDSDVRLHRCLDDLAANYGFFVTSENGWSLCNAVFGAAAGHPALAAMVRDLDSHAPDWALPPNVTTGPALFSKILRDRDDITVLPRETFFPYNYDEDPAPPHRFSYGTHLWAASWHAEYDARISRRPGLRQAGRTLKTFARRGRKWTRKRWAIAKERIAERVGRGPKRETALARDASALPPSGQLAALATAQTGHEDLHDASFMRRVLRGGDYFIDAGADSATVRMLTANLVGPFGRSMVINPDGALPHALEQSPPANAALRIDPASPGNPGNQGPVGVPLDREFPCGIPIKCLRVDANAQGLQVLLGAQRLLREQCVDYVLLRQNGASDAFRVKLHDALQGSGEHRYSACRVGGDGGVIPVNLAATSDGSGVHDGPLVMMSAFAAERALHYSSESAPRH